LFPSYSPSKIDTNSTIWNTDFSNAECGFRNEIYGRAALPCRPNQIAVRRPFTYAACLDVTQTIIFFFFWSRRLRSNRASGCERVNAGMRFLRTQSRIGPLNRGDLTVILVVSSRLRIILPLPAGDLSRLGSGEKNLAEPKVATQPSERARASQRRGGRIVRTKM
jgi:hypothetical protein